MPSGDVPIPKDLASLFSAIDSTLSLHYASSISTPKLGNVCALATNLAKKRVEPSTFELILAVDPNAYRIEAHPFDLGVAIPSNVSLSAFGTLLGARKLAFEKKLERISTISPIKLNDVAIKMLPRKRFPVSPSKIGRSPSNSPQTSPTKVLKNQSPRFKLRVEEREMSKAKGASILERIKLKERLAKESTEDPEAKYKSNIRNKMPQIYDIVYEMAGGLTSSSLPYTRVVSTIKDSLHFDIPELEVHDIIQALSERLKKIEMIQRGTKKVLKVAHLDREADLALIENTT